MHERVDKNSTHNKQILPCDRRQGKTHKLRAGSGANGAIKEGSGTNEAIKAASPTKPLMGKDPDHPDVSEKAFSLEKSGPAKIDQSTSENSAFRHGLQA